MRVYHALCFIYMIYNSPETVPTSLGGRWRSSLSFCNWVKSPWQQDHTEATQLKWLGPSGFEVDALSLHSHCFFVLGLGPCSWPLVYTSLVLAGWMLAPSFLPHRTKFADQSSLNRPPRIQVKFFNGFPIHSSPNSTLCWLCDGGCSPCIWRSTCPFCWACSSVDFNHTCSGAAELLTLTHHNCGFHWQIQVHCPNLVCLELHLKQFDTEHSGLNMHSTTCLLAYFVCVCMYACMSILQHRRHPVSKTAPLQEAVWQAERAPVSISLLHNKPHQHSAA